MASNSFFVGSRLKSIFVDAHDFARNQRNTTGGGNGHCSYFYFFEYRFIACQTSTLFCV